MTFAGRGRRRARTSGWTAPAPLGSGPAASSPSMPTRQGSCFGHPLQSRVLGTSLRSPPSVTCSDSEIQTGVQPTCAPVPDNIRIISMPSNRIYRTQYWSVTLPSDWTTSIDGDDLHVFTSPDGTATIRLSAGVIWRRGVIDDATIRAIAKEAGAPGLPSPLPSLASRGSRLVAWTIAENERATGGCVRGG